MTRTPSPFPQRDPQCATEIARGTGPRVEDPQLRGGDGTSASGETRSRGNGQVHGGGGPRGHQAQAAVRGGHLLDGPRATWTTTTIGGLPDAERGRTWPAPSTQPAGRRDAATTNPLGVKGCNCRGGGTIASTPRRGQFGSWDALRPVRHPDIVMPCTPERIWAGLSRLRGTSGYGYPGQPGECGHRAHGDRWGM